VLQPVPRDDIDLTGYGEQLRPPVRPLRGVVALPGQRPVEFPDPGGIVVRGVDGDGLVREEDVQRSEAAFDERGGCLIVFEVNPIEEVGAVAGVGPDGRREPLLGEVGRDPLRGIERCRVLGIRRGDPARPDRVDVDREPAPADDVGVGRGGVFPGEPHLDPVRPAGEEGRVDGV
jgi:hypothetical protein